MGAQLILDGGRYGCLHVLASPIAGLVTAINDDEHGGSSQLLNVLAIAVIALILVLDRLNDERSASNT